MKSPESAPIAEIVTVGTELLLHGRLDTNSVELGRALTDLGFRVERRTTVADDRSALARVVREASRRAPLLLITGGLGPTADDVTREAIGDAFDRPLRRDRRLVQELEERFRAFGRPMPRSNLRQADLPEGAEPLHNPEGSAPGLWLDHAGGTVVALPGPPAEMRAVLSAAACDRLRARFRPPATVRRALLTSGLAESALEDLIVDLYPDGDRTRLTVLARPGLVEVLVVAADPDAEQARRTADDLAERLRQRLGPAVFAAGEEPMTLAAAVGARLRRAGWTVAVAESCTGGLLGAELTETPGSSDYFLGGVVAYSDRSKQEQVGVPAELLARHGAVSEEVAVALAGGVRRRFAADFGLGITGVAGPGGGTADKPVGLVWLGLAGPQGTRSRRRQFAGGRDRVRRWAAASALQLLREAVEEDVSDA